MDAIGVGRVMALAGVVGALASVLAVVRLRVATWGEMSMALIYLANVLAFSVYSLLAKQFAAVADLPPDVELLWSSINRIHVAVMVASYAALLIVRACKIQGCTPRDLIRRLWTT